MIEIKMPREMEEVKGDLISRQAVIYYIKPYIQEIITESGVDKNEHTNRMLRAIINGIETMPTGKQQPCEDCISRAMAIDVVKKWFDLIELNSDICVDGLISLPSVTPQPKIGKWIEVFVETPNDPYSYGFKSHKCSKCEHRPLQISNYCPNCGSEMTELKTS